MEIVLSALSVDKKMSGKETRLFPASFIYRFNPEKFAVPPSGDSSGAPPEGGTTNF